MIDSKGPGFSESVASALFQEKEEKFFLYPMMK